MMTTKHSIQGIAITFTVVAMMASGCANKANNPRQQQTVPRMQMQNPTPANNLTNLNNRIQIANQAANKIVQLPGVNQANVLVTRRNAYVAAMVDAKHDPITQKLKDQMARKVRATDPNIQNVYVSTNPEFVNRINRYVADVQQGRPVSGFVEEFSHMIRNIFPTAR